MCVYVYISMYTYIPKNLRTRVHASCTREYPSRSREYPRVPLEVPSTPRGPESTREYLHDEAEQPHALVQQPLLELVARLAERDAEEQRAHLPRQVGGVCEYSGCPPPGRPLPDAKASCASAGALADGAARFEYSGHPARFEYSGYPRDGPQSALT
jgi:hypothetical protein